MKRMPIIDFVENDYHVKIKKCCVSCSHLCYDKNCVRRCSMSSGKVKKTDLCENWELRECLTRAGRYKNGVVRDKDTKEVILR